MIFVDTCILIDIAKGSIVLDSHKRYCINSVIEMEFIYGALNKNELKKIEKILNNFYLIELNQNIFDLSTTLMRKYSLSHDMTIYDAIIASTALVYDIPLWTHNKKDFRYLNIELI